jgi:hypothetical protein
MALNGDQIMRRGTPANFEDSRARVDEIFNRILALTPEEQELVAFKWQMTWDSPLDRLVKEGIEARNVALHMGLRIAEQVEARGSLIAEDLRRSQGKGRDVRTEKKDNRNALVRQAIETRLINPREPDLNALQRFVVDALGYEPKGRNGQAMSGKSMWIQFRRSPYAQNLLQ